MNKRLGGAAELGDGLESFTDVEFATRNGQTKRDNFSRKSLKGLNLLPEYLEVELLIRRKKESLAKGIAKKAEKTNHNRRDALRFSDSFETTCLYEKIA